MLTTTNTTIVSGMRPSTMKTVRIKVLRPFLVKGTPQPIGTELEVDAALAGELISASKAEKVTAAAAAPAEEMQPQSRGRKGKQDA